MWSRDNPPTDSGSLLLNLLKNPFESQVGVALISYL